MKKRASIFFFYDKDGIADRYIGYMLDGLREVSEYIVVVCNGLLSADGRKMFEDKADFVFCRENIGFDTWAFKEAIECVGWQKLYEFDELILCNFTMFGPFRSLKDVFDDMESSVCDFWGIAFGAKDEKVSVVSGTVIPYGYKPECVSSNFRVIRGKLLRSYEFRNFWTSLPMTATYGESWVYGEIAFTEVMRRAGYTYAIYGSDDIRLCASNTTEDMYYCLSVAKTPFIRRRAFTHSYDLSLNVGYGEDPRRVLEYIEKNTDYDVGMIVENILRTTGQNIYKERFCNNYIIPDNSSGKSYSGKKIAAVISFESERYIDNLCSYAANMPEGTDVFAAASSEELLESVKAAFSERNTGRLTAAVNEYGSPAAAFLITFRNELAANGYDYICFLNDSAVISGNEKESASLMYRCLMPICGSENIINNVIGLFEENGSIGIVSSNEIYHGEHFVSTIDKLRKHYDACEMIIEKLCNGICFNTDTLPNGCFGGEFWARPEVFKKLWENGSAEELFSDADTAEAAELCYPFIAQSCGYLTANVITVSQAEHDLFNYQYMLNKFKKVYYSKKRETTSFGRVFRYFSDLNKPQKQEPAGIIAAQRSYARLYTDCGSGYSEKTAIGGGSVMSETIYTHTFELTGKEKSLRFDPVDNSACIVRMISVESDRGLLTVKPINGFEKNNIMYFLNSDPQISIKLAGRSIKKLTVTAEIVKFSDSIFYSLFDSYKQNCRIIESYDKSYFDDLNITDDTTDPGSIASATNVMDGNVALYINSGKGYSEKDKVSIPYSTCASELFEHEYRFSSTPVSVRFDPLDGGCIVYGMELISSAGRLEAKNINGFETGPATVFFTSDPQFEIVVPPKQKIKSMRIRAFIIPLREKLMYEALSDCTVTEQFCRSIQELPKPLDGEQVSEQ